MRDKTPLASVTIHTASGLAAMPPSLCEGVAAMVAVTSFVLMSTRETVLSPQLGTQMLPKPAARPEHGRRPTVIAASTLLVLGSSRWMVFLGPFETQTASAVITCQSGVPSTGKTASGVMAVISRFTPGVETPGLGGRGWRGPLFGPPAESGGGGS